MSGIYITLLEQGIIISHWLSCLRFLSRSCSCVPVPVPLFTRVTKWGIQKTLKLVIIKTSLTSFPLSSRTLPPSLSRATPPNNLPARTPSGNPPPKDFLNDPTVLGTMKILSNTRGTWTYPGEVGKCTKADTEPIGYVRSKSPLAIVNLLERTLMGYPPSPPSSEHPHHHHQCSLGVAACYLLCMLTAALSDRYRCTATSMAFFDRLYECGAIRSNGSIVGCK